MGRRRRREIIIIDAFVCRCMSHGFLCAAGRTGGGRRLSCARCNRDPALRPRVAKCGHGAPDIKTQNKYPKRNTQSYRFWMKRKQQRSHTCKLRTGPVVVAQRSHFVSFLVPYHSKPSSARRPLPRSSLLYIPMAQNPNPSLRPPSNLNSNALRLARNTAKLFVSLSPQLRG